MFVPEEIIYKMQSRMQSKKADWEQRSVIIHTDCPLSSIEELLPWKEIAQACLEPCKAYESAEDIEKASQEKDANRIINLESFAHQMDLHTRKVVGNLLKTLSTSAQNKDSLKHLASKLNDARQIYMQELRENKLQLQLTFPQDQVLEQLISIFEERCQQIVT
jgi:hypothetical protein